MYVVYFHNVVDRPLDRFDRRLSRVSVGTFARQVEALCAELRPRPLPELVVELGEGRDDHRAVAITFDDAYRGVLDHALPVLDARGATATVFTVTGTLTSQLGAPFHFDELELAFRLTRRRWLRGPPFGGLPQPIFTTIGRVRFLKRFKRWLKLQPENRRRAAHREVLRRLDVDADQLARAAATDTTYATLDPAGLRRLVAAGWTVGAHSRTHRTLSRLDDEELRDEVAGSRADLKSVVGDAWMPFAYPYGRPDHVGRRVRAAVAAAGYDCAFTTEPGVNLPGVDLFGLRRYEFHELAGHLGEIGSRTARGS